MEPQRYKGVKLFCFRSDFFFFSWRVPQAPDRKVPAVIRQSTWLKAWTAKAILFLFVEVLSSGMNVFCTEMQSLKDAVTRIFENHDTMSWSSSIWKISMDNEDQRDFGGADYDFKNADIQQWANKWKFRKSKIFTFFLFWNDMKNALCVCPLVYFYPLNEFSISAHPKTVCHTTSKHLLHCFHVCCGLSFGAETTSHFSGWTWWLNSSG